MMSCPESLVEYLRVSLNRPDLRVDRYERLSGGAIQQNMALDLVSDDAQLAIDAVLRTDSATSVSVSLSRLQEFAILQAAFDAGVLVPEPLLKCMDASIIGAPFFVMARVEGRAQPHLLTRKSVLDESGREHLVSSIGRALAQVHAIPLDDERLSFLERPSSTDLLRQRVAFYRRCLDELKAHRPVIEWALAWLDRQRIRQTELTLCHNDFRTGNLMIQDDTLTGILDWEFTGVGDPHEDLGWFCAPCWRFAARDREAGGLGERQAFYLAYERESGRIVDHGTVAVMEVLATIRWAIIALQQGARFDSGQEPTLELGLTGRMIAELEQDLLQLVPACERLIA